MYQSLAEAAARGSIEINEPDWLKEAQNRIERLEAAS